MTLTGPPGAGKTRLSLAIAEQLQDEFGGGACFVPLASVSDAARVPNAIAQALVDVTGGQPLIESLYDYLYDKQLLLVLDNFEQVLAAALSCLNYLLQQQA